MWSPDPRSPDPEPSEHVAVRQLVVHHGNNLYPVVCRANLREVLLYHHQTKSYLPIPWLEFLNLIAEPLGLSTRQFLRFLLDQEEVTEDGSPPAAASAPPHGGPDATPRHPERP